MWNSKYVFLKLYILISFLFPKMSLIIEKEWKMGRRDFSKKQMIFRVHSLSVLFEKGP